jgi:hypothetical protein
MPDRKFTGLLVVSALIFLAGVTLISTMAPLYLVAGGILAFVGLVMVGLYAYLLVIRAKSHD